MRTTTKALLAIAVVVAIVLAYWTFVGFSSAIDDFIDNLTEKDSPSDPSNPKGYIAYAQFTVTVSVWTWSPYSVARGTIDRVVPEVKEFVSLDTGRVYERDKLGLGIRPPPAEVVGHFWITVLVTGPNGYSATWEDESRTPIFDYNTDDNQAWAEYHTGRALFVSEGTYQVLVTLYAEMTSGWSGLLKQTQQTFEVDV